MARGGGAAEEEEEEEGMAVSETLTADSADEERRRGSSSSASSVAASSGSYCPPDEWQQVAIKTCLTDDAKPKAKPTPGEKKPPAVDACAERHRAPELELMKERFSKLLLGEDMSGSGKGVCTALAISNAITNLCATIFGQLWRLEPLAPEKKAMWRREMEWLLCVSDHIVELVPTWQTFPDGTRLEIMTSRPTIRSVHQSASAPEARPHAARNTGDFQGHRVLVRRPGDMRAGLRRLGLVPEAGPPPRREVVAARAPTSPRRPPRGHQDAAGAQARLRQPDP
ncbi:hypothetical protein ACQ4PT_049983 [Festuca glaucescens]